MSENKDEATEESQGRKFINDSCEKVYPNSICTENQQMIALLVQLNINMQRLSDLMFIATGLSEDDIPETDADTYTDNAETLSLKDSSLMCPFCHQATIIDDMGYCKKCKRDVAGHLHKRKL